MDASRGDVIVVEDSRYREHRGPEGHPERPERLSAVGASIAARADRLEALAPRPAEPDELLRVHGREHLALVAEAARRGPTRLDADTFVSTASLDVARLAAGGAVDLARRVARGDARAGFAAVRPPGHHAEADHAMGFCLFNNVAVAARALQHDEGVGRVFVLDWDVHHGNGTQHCFDEDPTVLYASTHQFPYYPGSGDFAEAGRGLGAGATVNVPLPAGCGDGEYVGVLQRVIVPAAQAFRPEIILVSCGFDAHRDDPLAAMEVSGDGFGAMAAVVRTLADDLCGGRLALVLEGGYSLEGLREGMDAVLDVLLDPAPAAPDDVPVVRGGVLERVLGQVFAVHGENFARLRAF
jgi:acetoin utilization deacetylase AcuC-like enzyme